jgi:hypothetical protein
MAKWQLILASCDGKQCERDIECHELQNILINVVCERQEETNLSVWLIYSYTTLEWLQLVPIGFSSFTLLSFSLFGVAGSSQSDEQLDIDIRCLLKYE